MATSENEYMNEEMLCQDATEGAEARIPKDRMEQLARLEAERDEEISASRFEAPKSFKRHQEKSRKQAKDRKGAEALIAQLEADMKAPPPAAPPTALQGALPGKRLHKSASVKVSASQQAEYDRMAKAALKAKDERFSIGEDYAAESTAAAALADPAGANPPKKEFAIGFDYAGEADLGEVLAESRAATAAGGSVQGQPPQQQFTRKATVVQIPEKAAAAKRSAAASLLAAELAAESVPATSRPRKAMSRQKSVSVAVNGPAVPEAELARPMSKLLQAAWMVPEGLGRDVFEQMVGGGMDGDFLVRKSGSSAGYVLCINDFGEPVNYSITASGDRFEFLGQLFVTLDDVVAHACSTPLKSRTLPGEKLALGFPVPQQRWFAVPSMGRAEVEGAVQAGGHSSFAVRMSSTGDKYVLVVNDSGAVCSYSITKSGRKWVFGGSAHRTIDEVVAHIKVNPFQSKTTPALTLGSSAL